MITIKYYLYVIAIALLKPFVYIEKKYNQYNEWKLKMLVRNQIMSDSNYNIDVLRELAKDK